MTQETWMQGYNERFPKRKAQSPYMIYKYQLVDQQSFTLPKEAHFLSVGVQGTTVVLWAAVPLNSTRDQVITPYIRGTGWASDIPLEYYFGTVTDSDNFVWHIFLERQL